MRVKDSKMFFDPEDSEFRVKFRQLLIDYFNNPKVPELDNVLVSMDTLAMGVGMVLAGCLNNKEDAMAWFNKQLEFYRGMGDDIQGDYLKHPDEYDT